MQGYCPDHPHIAHMERYLDEKGTLADLSQAFREASGTDWVRSATPTSSIVMTLSQPGPQPLGQSTDAAEKWIDGAEEHFVDD